MRKASIILSGAVFALLTTVSTASAAVTFDPATGTGFAGKGDVQLVLGLNNAQLQSQAASLTFATESTSLTDTTWTCTKTSNENTQERSRATTTTTQGVVSSVARDNRNGQVTGFNLNGYSGTPTTSSTSEGPAVGSCPTGWVVTEGPTTSDPQVSGELLVNGVLLYSF